MDLKGKVIVITGAAQGLGRKMAEKVAACGANVVLTDLDPVKLKDTVCLCAKAGGEAKDGLCMRRSLFLDPLNHTQIELLKCHRAGDTDERVVKGIHLAINGIAAGLRNSG